ncbi:MAG: hypothetical protein MZU95_01270 [Desulfomicrobium escambiense]|nr:hypothetical protein [Desulfomicrobium escambiense]
MNVSAAESDLTPFDPAELHGGRRPRARAARRLPRRSRVTPSKTTSAVSRCGGICWPRALLLLAIEAAVAGRFPRIAQG